MTAATSAATARGGSSCADSVSTAHGPVGEGGARGPAVVGHPPRGRAAPERAGRLGAGPGPLDDAGIGRGWIRPDRR